MKRAAPQEAETYGEAGMLAGVVAFREGEAENFGVEPERFIEVGNLDGDMLDSFKG